MIKKHLLSFVALALLAATALAQTPRAFILDSIPVAWTVTADGAPQTITPYASPLQHLGYTSVAEGSQLVFTPSTQNTLVQSVRLIKRVGKTIMLNQIAGNIVVQNGDTLRGTLDGSTQTYKITISDGATVVLDGVTINGSNNNACAWAGINCEGDATIVLNDGSTNSVCGFYYTYPGINVPVGHTLTICGGGSLTAQSRGFGAGIGGGDEASCGNIVITGGTITATGGMYAAGIGSGNQETCGDITITGGTITATGGQSASGIGRGASGSCGNITITSDVVSVTATKGTYGTYSIGTSDTCTVTIGGVEGPQTTSTYTYNGNGIGSGSGSGSTIQDDGPDTISAQQQPSGSWSATMPSGNRFLSVSALDLVTLTLGVNNSQWGRLSVKGVSNSEEMMEEFVTDDEDTLNYEREHFRIAGNDADEDGIYMGVSGRDKVRIAAKNGELISRVEMEVGYNEDWDDHYLVTSSGSVSGSYAYGDIITINDVNDHLLTIHADYDPDSYGLLQGIKWRIYYTTSRLPDSVFATQTEGVYAVVPGKEVVLQATAADFKHLESWSNGAAPNTQRNNIITVTTDTSINATFAPDTLHFRWKYYRNGYIDMPQAGLTFYRGFEGDSLSDIDLYIQNYDYYLARVMYDRGMVSYGSTNPAVVSFSGRNIVVNGSGSCILYAVHDGSVFAYDSVAFPITILDPPTLTLASNNEEWGSATLATDSLTTDHERLWAMYIESNGVSEGENIYFAATRYDYLEEEVFMGRNDTIVIASYDGEIISRVEMLSYSFDDWDGYSVEASAGDVSSTYGEDDTVFINNVNSTALRLTVAGEGNPDGRLQLRFFKVYYYDRLRTTTSDNVYKIVPGTEIAVKGTPASKCYYLSAWSDNAEVNAEGLNTFTLTDSKTLTAIFDAHEFAGDTTAEAVGSFTWHGETYTATPAVAPTYTTTTAEGCDSIVTLHLTITAEEAGINDVETVAFSVAPNPVQRGGQVSITIDGAAAQQGMLMVFDAQGRNVGNYEIRNLNFEHSTFTFQHSKLATGLYTLRLVLSDGRAATKTIVVK